MTLTGPYSSTMEHCGEHGIQQNMTVNERVPLGIKEVLSLEYAYQMLYSICIRVNYL